MSPAFAACLFGASLLLPAAVRAFPPTPEPAPGLPTIRPNDAARTSSIGPEDPVANERHYEDYNLTLDAGDVVQIEMDSDQFDGYLELFGPDHALVAFNDDREPSVTNPRIVFTARDRGTYVVRAQDFFEGRGEYTLSVRRAPRPQSTLPQLAAGDSGQGGRLGPANSVMSVESGRAYRYVAYRFDGEQGDRVRIDMSSGQVDSFLQLLGENGNVIDQDDNSGNGLNARIVSVLPRPGHYVVRAAAPVEQAGDFQLRLRRDPVSPARAENIRRLTLGAPIEPQSLGGPGSGVILHEGGRVNYFYDLYTIDLQADQVVTVNMDADGFNPVLEAGAWSPLGFATAVIDDDNVRGGHAQLVLRPRQGGVIFVRARAFGSNTGAYRLTLTSGEPPAAP